MSFRVPAALCAALTLAAAPAAHAQSLLAARGLGFGLEATDARARALGGAAAVMPQGQFSLVNPAVLAGLPAAGLTVTFQSDAFSAELPGEAALDLTTARFPAIQLALPVARRMVASVGYAGVLDQNWSAVRTDTVLDRAGADREVVDQFVSRGGASRFRAGLAYAVLPRLDVGVGLDVYTGAFQDSVLREFTDGALDPTLTGTRYQWEGLGASAGARWRGGALTVSAAVTAGGDLTAEPADSAAEAARSYALPVMVNAGASARISQNATVALAGRWEGWSSVDDALAGEGTADDALAVGGGVEFDALRLFGRPLPVRLGGRWARLPFRWDEGADQPEERALTAGLGIRFGGGAAMLDVAGERGMRGGDAAVLDEAFWRVSVSLSLIGR